MTKIDKILNVLPQGSGFDCKWEHLRTQKNGTEVFETFFHNMNEDGFYDGFTRIRLYIDTAGDFRIGMAGKARYRDYWGRYYYMDTINDAFSEYYIRIDGSVQPAQTPWTSLKDYADFRASWWTVRKPFKYWIFTGI